MALKQVKCPHCGSVVKKKAHNAKYCSQICRQKAYEKRKGIKPYDRAKTTKKKTQPINSPLPYPEIVNEALTNSEHKILTLRNDRIKLLNKFTRLTTKSEKQSKLISNLLGAGAAAYGFTKLKENEPIVDSIIKVIGIPLLFRALSKNIADEVLQDNPKDLWRLTQLKMEISKIDEDISTLQLQSIAEKEARKIAIQSAPQIERTDSFTAITADEMKKIKRTIYKLSDKWKYFLGNIEQNFKAIIHGKPKQGKSHFAIQLAQYLHENHGEVVYFAAEEGASINMENKLTRWNAKFKVVYNILGTKGIEDYIKKYKPKFVFIDSISRLRLSADNINFFVDEYIDTAWIMIAQSTKQKGHRGSQELTHLTDSIIEVVEGIAYQKGRTVNGETQIDVFVK